jgi:ABC-type branched-subunit amino acid transport system ATPase component
MKILATKNLTKHFQGVYALNGVSLEFEQGHITGIVGPNGSGKSTLTNVLSGMLKLDGGSVIINDVQLTSIQPFDLPAFGLTRTFQEIRLFEQMTVLDNILVVLTSRHVLSSLLEKHTELHLKQAEEILNTVGLGDKRHHLAKNLSYGQRKLLEIGRTLAMDAKIFLFDEPFAGLFPEMVKTVVSVMNQLKLQGRTIVLIEHNMDLIRQLCDHLYVLDGGELLAEGNPDQVLSQKKVIEAYLGE